MKIINFFRLFRKREKISPDVYPDVYPNTSGMPNLTATPEEEKKKNINPDVYPDMSPDVYPKEKKKRKTKMVYVKVYCLLEEKKQIEAAADRMGTSASGLGRKLFIEFLKEERAKSGKEK